MKLSAPIYRLKREARVLSRQEGIPLCLALDRIAAREGFARWGLLAARHAAESGAERLFSRLRPGNLVLVGARPGQGKTLLGLNLAVEAMKAGRQGVFFTLEYAERECRERFRALGVDPATFGGLFELDCSDQICAEHIVRRLSACAPGTLAVVDYLQLLDQRRETPELREQMQALKAFAQERGVILVFISQIDRSYDPAAKPCPDIDDVRLPNPLDLRLFDKACFLNEGEVRYVPSVAGRT
ncbi:MAG TPA: DNA helicase [Fimbriimonadaceae bacterium]|nr:DNA helicase [Fimbriimonadaceae bacterium]